MRANPSAQTEITQKTPMGDTNAFGHCFFLVSVYDLKIKNPISLSIFESPLRCLTVDCENASNCAIFPDLSDNYENFESEPLVLIDGSDINQK